MLLTILLLAVVLISITINCWVYKAAKQAELHKDTEGHAGKDRSARCAAWSKPSGVGAFSSWLLATYVAPGTVLQIISLATFVVGAIVLFMMRTVITQNVCAAREDFQRRKSHDSHNVKVRGEC